MTGGLRKNDVRLRSGQNQFGVLPVDLCKIRPVFAKIDWVFRAASNPFARSIFYSSFLFPPFEIPTVALGISPRFLGFDCGW